jgi:hypothetical protein
MLLLHEAPGLLRALWVAALSAFVVAVAGIIASEAQAQLKIYYDPATGNVALDTAATRTGAIYGYGFFTSYFFLVDNRPVPVPFRPENHIRVTPSPFYFSNEEELSESLFSNPIRGLFTLGNIFPAGLSEEVWFNAFHHTNSRDPLFQSWWETLPHAYNYTDAIGEGPALPAEFIYGTPDREFDNKWDLVDPATLPWAKTATLVYRAWNGEVLLDTTGVDSGYISYFLLKSNGEFLPAGYTPFTNSPFYVAEPNLVSLTGDAIEPGQYSLGEILQAGLSATEFENLFTEARFIGRAGFNGGSFNFETDGVAMTLQFVPEPSAMLLLALGTPLLAWGRKRPAARR